MWHVSINRKKTRCWHYNCLPCRQTWNMQPISKSSLCRDSSNDIHLEPIPWSGGTGGIGKLRFGCRRHLSVLCKKRSPMRSELWWLKVESVARRRSATILAKHLCTILLVLVVCFEGEIFSPNSQWIIHIVLLGEHTGNFARGVPPRGSRGGENLPFFGKHFFAPACLYAFVC